MKKLNPDLKIIMASGYFDPNIRSEMIKAGVQAFVEKPYQVVEILQTIRTVLDKDPVAKTDK